MLSVSKQECLSQTSDEAVAPFLANVRTFKKDSHKTPVFEQLKMGLYGPGIAAHGRPLEV